MQKEFFQEVIAELVDPASGFFLYSEDARATWLSPVSERSLDDFRVAGKIIGLALYNADVVGMTHPLAFYKLLAAPLGAAVGGFDLTYHDLKDFNPSVYGSYVELLEYAGDVEADMFLTFDASFDVYGVPINRVLKVVPG